MPEGDLDRPLDDLVGTSRSYDDPRERARRKDEKYYSILLPSRLTKEILIDTLTN